MKFLLSYYFPFISLIFLRNLLPNTFVSFHFLNLSLVYITIFACFLNFYFAPKFVFVHLLLLQVSTDSGELLNSIAMVQSMGYNERQARAALAATDNNLER